MNYAIIGAGNVGQALAKAFGRKEIKVALASRRSPEELAPVATAAGSSVTATTMQEAAKSDVVLLAVPFDTHEEVAKAVGDWQGKIIVDVTNAFGVPPETLGDRPSSEVVAKAFKGAALVKAFNSLDAKTLAENPEIKGGRRVVFLSSDDEAAAKKVESLVEELGFAPVMLGKLTEGGLLIQARGKTWAPLIFQKLVKFDETIG